MKTKTPTEELQYLGQMLSASTIEDTDHIESIQKRISEIVPEAESITDVAHAPD